MNREITSERLKKFKLEGVTIGDTILFCHSCEYQNINVAMKPICPECGDDLYLLKISGPVFDEIERSLKNSGK